MLDMRSACAHVPHMSTTMIQIRNVPDALHRRLKARAATLGLSLSDYLRGEIEKVAARPTPEELIERLRALPPVELPMSAADLVREGRQEREDELTAAFDERRD